ncbi:MAG: hypothetical protein ACKOFX_04370, partial [Solirubrobacterales bacterium]
AILANGTSASSWLILGANDQIRTRTQDRAGSSLGPDTLVASLPVGTNLADWEITAAGNGFIFLWVEATSGGGSRTETLKYRTMSATSALGPVTTLDTATVGTTEGTVDLGGISASPGGNIANVSWNLYDRRGAVASNCDLDSFQDSDGPCTLTQKLRFARIAEDGSLVMAPTDLISRQYTSNNTACGASPAIIGEISSNPASGAATVVISDTCRPAGGQQVNATLFSRISAAGQASQPEVILLDSPYYLDGNQTMSTDGTTVVPIVDRIYSIPPKGAVPDPIVNVTELEQGWSAGFFVQAIALPNGQTIAVWEARKESGSDLISSVWTRLVKADGTFVKPKQIFTRTTAQTTPGDPLSFDFYSRPAIGLGRDTGTLLVTTRAIDRQSSSALTWTNEATGLGINRKGSVVSGSEQLLESETSSWSSLTHNVELGIFGQLDVAADGTASALIFSSSLKKSVVAPFPGTAQASITSSKLVRNPNTCGVTPSLCKANVKVKGLKVSGRGSKTQLTITLKNSGNKDASKVKAKLTASGGAKAPKTVSFPKVLEGKTAKKTVKVSGSGTIKVKVGKSSKTIRL